MTGVFLYDGDCGFCTTSARWLQRHATSTARVEAWQYADLAPLGLTPADCAEALMYVDDGRRVVGPDAVAALLGTGKSSWRTAGQLLAAPGSRRVAWPVYEWISHHRGHLPGGPPATELPREVSPVKGVRRRRSRDLAASARLLRVVFADGQYPVVWPEAPRSWLAGDDVIDAWVVEQQGEMLGHIAISRVGLDPVSALKWREVTGREPSELAGISRFFVRPRARGRGIGSALLEVAVAEVRARGLVPVLDVVSASRDAISLYEQKGWRMIAMYPWGDKGADLWIYFYAAPPEA
ncbi:MAG TPA: GNAT family N-acetyltransferase [Nocardioidaceae bacterium]|nr:GNAT family N-acetyltransferase [Nocardioidaceae bacterium]